jgi:hypothetical protein
MMEKNLNQMNWKCTNFQDFWAEIAPADHVLQIYENERVFMNTLEGFAGSGFLAGDSVVIIATSEHLSILEDRLAEHNFDLQHLRSNGRYFGLNAHDVLNSFMRGGWPDEELFSKVIGGICTNASKNGRRLRAFGEMVALLWAQGNNGATVQLEHLWNKFCSGTSMCLYCAYPKTGFTKTPVESINEICCTHARVISGAEVPSTEIHYKNAVDTAVIKLAT